MSNSLGTLTLDLVAEVSRFNSGLDKASRIADQNAKKIQQNLQNIDDKINTVTASIKKFGAALGIGLSVNALHGWIKGATQAASDTAVFANRIDVTVESLTAMRYVAEQTGVSIDSFDASMMRLTRRLGAAVNGGGPAIATLERLGLSAESLLKMPLEDRLKTIGSAMQNLETQAERLTAAQDLAGDSARQLVPMFMMQGDEIDELADRGRRLGFVFSDEIANSADSVLSSLGDISGALSNLAFYIAGKFLPTIEEALNRITVDDIENALNGIKKGLDLVITSGKVLALLFFGRLTASLYASASAFVASQIQAMRYQATLAQMAGVSKGAAIGLTALGTATKGVTVAMGALGGPVGLLAVAAGSLVMFGSSASKAGVNIDELNAKVSGLSENIQKLTKNQAISSKNSFNDDIRELEKELRKLEYELSRADKAVEILSTRLATEKLSTKHYEAIQEKLKEWERKQQDIKGEIDDATIAINRASEAITTLDGHIASLSDTTDLSTRNIIERFEKLTAKIRDEIGRIGLTGNVAIFEYELKNTDKYSDFSESQIAELRALYAQKDAEEERYKLANQANRIKSKGKDIAEEYRRIMESTLSDEERRGLELQKNLDILRQYGATEEEMLAVRRAAYESMSVDLPGYDGSGDTLTAQLARINENIAELDQWREEQLQKIQQAYGDEENALAESIARKEEIERAYRERRSQYEGELNQELLNMAQSLSSETLSALETAGLEASGIYKALFLANKAAAFANAVISAQVAGVKAMEAYSSINPSMAIAMGKMITGVGMVNAGIIAGTALRGFATGGYTGPGGKYEPAGIVHAGEVVFSQDDIRRLGGVQIVESIRTGKLPGFKEGGVVGLGAMNIPDRTFKSFNQFSPEINITVHVSEDGKADAEAYDGLGKKIDERIKVTVKREIATAQRPGGVLARR